MAVPGAPVKPVQIAGANGNGSIHSNDNGNSHSNGNGAEKVTSTEAEAAVAGD